jgi:hypothetical protein
MDAKHFDHVTRLLRVLPSRRNVLIGLVAAGLGLSALGFPVGVAARKKGKKRKRKKRKRQPALPPPLSPSPPSSPPALQTRADATCAGMAADSMGGETHQRIAQTFTAGASGPLVGAQLLIGGNSGTGSFVLRLAPLDGSDVPTNAVLAETAVASSSVPDGKSIITFTFAHPFPVVAGTRYALVLTRPEGGLFFWGGDNDLGCAGQCFLDPDQPEQMLPFEACVFPTDLIFTTFVRS